MPVYQSLGDICDALKQQSRQIVIFSIGSSYRQDASESIPCGRPERCGEQQEPTFAQSLACAIINIDPAFVELPTDLDTQKEGHDIFYVRCAIQTGIKTVFEPSDATTEYQTLQDIILWLLQQNKQVIFMLHTHYFDLLRFTGLISSCIQYSNFKIIGSYADGFPVIIYSRQFLDEHIRSAQEFMGLSEAARAATPSCPTAVAVATELFSLKWPEIAGAQPTLDELGRRFSGSQVFLSLAAVPWSALAPDEVTMHLASPRATLKL